MLLQIFNTKKCQKKNHPASNSARFCLQSKEKILSLKIFGRMQIWSKKIEGENPIDDDLEKSLSDEYDNKADNDSNDDDEKDESNE